MGDRHRHIVAAAERVAAFLSSFRLSSIIETAAVGAGLEHDPPYLNAVGVGESDRPAREIYEALRSIERDAGRTRPYQGAPRTLDLDLILAGDEIVEDTDLQIPHPRFRERLFVLIPLCEVAPELVDPVTHLTIRQLHERLNEKRPEH